MGDPEEQDEYTAENILFVLETACWSLLVSQAKFANIGMIVDTVM